MERLEGRKAEMIRKMIDVKRRELEEICTESHMPVPALPSSEAAPESQAAASAQVASSTDCNPVSSEWKQPFPVDSLAILEMQTRSG